MAKSTYLSPFSFSVIFTPRPASTAKSTICLFLLLLFVCKLLLGLIFWLGLGRLLVSQNPKEFVLLVLLDGFWFVHIQFGSKVKFRFLVQFPVGPLLQLVVSCLVVLLR